MPTVVGETQTASKNFLFPPQAQKERVGVMEGGGGLKGKRSVSRKSVTGAAGLRWWKTQKTADSGFQKMSLFHPRRHHLLLRDSSSSFVNLKKKTPLLTPSRST